MNHTLPSWVAERVRAIPPAPAPSASVGTFVLYWMRTAVRGHENPALEAALAAGHALGLPVLVYHALSERYPFASDRHHRFILEGARDVARELAGRGIHHAFHLERPGHRGPHLRTLAGEAALMVTEEMPVAPLAEWTTRLAQGVETPVWAVDAACTYPMRLVPPAAVDRAFRFRKATEGGRRERLARLWDPLPAPPGDPPALPFAPVPLGEVELSELVAACAVDHTVGPVPGSPGGSRAGYRRWEEFREGRLRQYHRNRNDPLRPGGVSRMSPYLHYGQVSPFRLAREAAEVGGAGAEKYLEELLVWRELAYAFCFHRRDHGGVGALPLWARETLAAREGDPRKVLPSLERLSRGRTGDPLWDAAQRSLLVHGELHNNVRMTWGKALLGWTRTAQEALTRLEELNHRYALDGRDPASYGGILWAMGQFDRPFSPEQPILGSVRPRPTSHHARRLDVERYAALAGRPYRPRPPRVAVIGAGVAGLTCARTLADHGVPVMVLDKGRRPGGRLSTREHGPRRFDHGAQFFTARDPRFRRMVEGWQEEGVVAEWSPRIVRLDREVGMEPARTARRFVGVPGMQSLAAHLGEELPVRCGVQVTGVEAGPPPTGPGAPGWIVRTEAGEGLGPFEIVVVALPPKQAAPLLEASPGLSARATGVEMAPCWTVMVEFPERLALPFDAAFVAGSPLTWVAREESKPGRGGTGLWVLQGAPEWSGEQAGAEPDVVAATLMEEFRALAPTLPEPHFVRTHFWRYALPAAPLPEEALWDGEAGLGACGDWCAGPRVEGAWLSGAAMAGRILNSSLEGPEAKGAPPAPQGTLFPH